MSDKKGLSVALAGVLMGTSLLYMVVNFGAAWLYWSDYALPSKTPFDVGVVLAILLHGMMISLMGICISMISKKE